MPAVSKKQQKFFGIVRAIQKGEMAPTSPETAKAAADMKKGDVKKFASTKHKGLPEKKKIEEDRQIKKIIKQLRKSVKAHDKQADTLEKKIEEESNPRIPRKKGQPANSKKHSDLYTDENPKGTIHGLGFKNVATAKASVSKIRNSSRSHAHKIQAAVAMEQRAREMGKTSEAAVYRKYINSMKKKTKKMNEAANPAQQAAIAISMKKKGKKPKNINEFINFEDAKKKREAWRKSLDNKGDFTKWKPGVNVPGVSKDIKYEPFKHGSHVNPLTYKDKPVNASTVGNEIKSRAVGGIKKGLDFVKANPGKTALIGAGVVGAGMLAKKALTRNKDKEVKEQTTFPQMQERIRNAKERRREQQKKSEKLYIDTKRKGVKFYDKKGTGRLKDGKKVYD